MRLFDLPPVLRPSVALRNKGRLPAKPGVYYAIQWWKPFKPLYIGMGGNMQLRWSRRSFGDHHKLAELSRRFGVRLHYRVTQTRSLAERLEAIEIRRYRPSLNRRLEPLKKDVFRDILDFCSDSVLIGVVLSVLMIAIVVVTQ